jgi:nitroreductase
MTATSARAAFDSADFDLAQVDALLSTTRAVRKRLDFDREVPDDVLLECLQLAVQAPTGSNRQGWRWLVVRDQATKDALADIYRRAGGEYLAAAAATSDSATQSGRVMDSANFLAEHLGESPVLVIPMIIGRVEELVGSMTPAAVAAGLMGSILPAVWSFQLALRSRGLGSCYTTLHLLLEQEAADLLGIPPHMTQAGLLPVAYTTGTSFRPADRPPVEAITYLDAYKRPIR